MAFGLVENFCIGDMSLRLTAGHVSVMVLHHGSTKRTVAVELAPRPSVMV